MATIYNWKSGTTGDWGNAADWSGNAFPNSTIANVTIAGAGSSVTVAGGESFSVTSLTLGSGNPFLEVDGILNFGGTSEALVLKSGTLDVTGGTLAGANIQQTGGTLKLYGATLDDVTYSGTLNVLGYDNNLYIENGLTSSGGVIKLNDPTYGDDSLRFLDSETLNSQTIVVGSANPNGYPGGSVYDEYGTLTLGAKTEILQAATITYDGGVIYGNVVNDGLISVAAGQFNISGSYDYITGQYDDNFVNTAGGIIAIGGAGTVAISVPTFDNAGLISVANGGVLDLQQTIFTNTGGISLASGGELEIQGSIALSQLGSITFGNGALFNIDNGGTFDLGGGTLDIKIGGEFANVVIFNGTLANGVIKPDGGTLTLENATLDDVTYSGTLNVFGASNILRIENGLTATGGVINLNDPNGGGNSLYFEDSETLNNQSILVGSSNPIAYGGGVVIDEFGTLTLGANTEILQASTTTYGGVIYGNVVNDGLISVAAGAFNISSSYDYVTNDYDDDFINAASGTIAIGGTSNFVIQIPTFENAGLISVAAGQNYIESTYDYETRQIKGDFINDADGTVVIGAGAAIVASQYTTFDNAGLITVASGGLLDMQLNTFINTGIISLASGGELEIQDSIGLAALGSVNSSAGALIDIDDLGTLDLGGGTLDIKAGGEFANVLVNRGTLANGFIAAGDGGTLTLNHATLSNITYSGTLNVLGANNVLYIENGLTGTGGEINLTDPSYPPISLEFLDSETLNNQTILVGGNNNYGSGGGTVYDQYGTLTLGAGTEILQAANSAQYGGIAGNYIVNQGVISIASSLFSIEDAEDYVTRTFDDVFVNAASGTIAIGAGAELSVYAPTFDNIGLLQTTGGTISLAPTKFTNMPNSALIGGIFDIEAGGTLLLPQTITVDAANIILSGAGSEIESGTTTIEKTLTSISSAGILQILGSRGYAGSKTITDSGSLVLGGGTFSPALTVASSGHVSGFGKFSGPIADNGLITATQFTLTLAGAVSGTGGLLIDAGAALVLGAGAAGTNQITFGGTQAALVLDAPASVTGPFVSLAASDTIDLAGTLASSASIANGSLVVSLTAGGTLAYALNNPAGLDRVGTSSDGHGGSDIILFQEAQAGSIAPAGVNFGDQHVGAALGEFYTISNTGPAGGYTENLDASFGAGSGGLTTSGSLTGLAGGASNGTALAASLNTAGPGTVSGTGIINLYTDGTGVPGDGLGTLAIGTQTISQTATLFDYATAATVTPVGFGQHHVGDALSQFITIGNAAAPGIYSEGLDASFSGTSANLTGSGGVTTLAAGGTSGSALAVTLNSATAGVQTGVATLALASDGAGIDTLGTTALAAQTVAASGTLFNYATAAAATLVNFGIVHVGQAGVSQAVVLGNIATPGLFSEGLDAGFSGTSIGFTSSGSVSGLAAGGTSGTALNIGLATNKAGVFGGTTTLGLVSDGAGIDSLGTTVLGSDTISLAGTVNNYATVGLDLISGPGKLTVNGATTLSLNLGTVVKGGADPAENIGIVNAARGPADLLSGSLSLSGSTSAFVDNSAISFSGIAAGSTSTGHTISLKTTNIGTFSETIVLHASGSNASGYSGTLAAETFIVTGTVTSAAAVTSAGAMRFVAPNADIPATPPAGIAAWFSVPSIHASFQPPQPAAPTPLATVVPTGIISPFAVHDAANATLLQLHNAATSRWLG